MGPERRGWVGGERKNGPELEASLDALPSLTSLELDTRLEAPPSREQVAEALQRKHQLDVLRPLLGPTDEAALDEIMTRVEAVSLRSGDVLFHQGDPGDALYIVVHGLLEVIVERDGLAAKLFEVRRGDVVGEFSVLVPQPRSGTVRALRDTELVRIAKACFDRWVVQRPKLSLEIAKGLVTRAQLANRGPRTASPRAVAIAAHRGATPRSLLRDLEATLCGYGRFGFLSSEGFDGRFGGLTNSQTLFTDAQNALLVAILFEQENEHDRVIYVCDPNDTPWTRRCFRQADRIWIVGHSNDQVDPGRLERLAAEVSPTTPRDLLLLHPRDCVQPRNTASWLSWGRFRRHHHVREGDDAHLHRLARHLTGRSIGLVASGGGARGYAHLGVWRALREGGLTIDHFGGTSMGALLTAVFARGASYEEVVERSRRFAQPKRLFDYTLPFAALMRSKKLQRFLRELYGDVHIEDLWIPYFAVATDLSRAERLVFDRGPLREAVRASISIPGVFVPVVRDGNVVVDGGVVDNLPVEEMLNRSESRSVIAVNVAPPRLPPRHYDLHGEVSGWWLLFNRLNPFAPRLRIPSAVATLVRALEIHSARSVAWQREQASLLLEPDMRSIGILDFRRFQQAADLGYAASKTGLEAWTTRGTEGFHSREVIPHARK